MSCLNQDSLRYTLPCAKMSWKLMLTVVSKIWGTDKIVVILSHMFFFHLLDKGQGSTII